MKRNIFCLRALILLLMLTLLLSVAILPTAAKETEALEPTETFAVWEYDERRDELTAYFPESDTTAVYAYYKAHPLIRFGDADRYIYERELSIDGVTYEIVSPFRAAGVVVLESETAYTVYVHKGYKEALNELTLGRDFGHTTLTYVENGYLKSRNMGNDFYAHMKALSGDPMAETRKETLRDLRYAPRFELWAYDEEDFIALNVGVLLELEGEMFYLDVLSLPDSCLDENGELRPVDTEVTLYRLPDGKQEEAYSAAHNGYTVHYEITREEDEQSMAGVSAVFVYFTVVLLGILVPVIPLVLGLGLARTRSEGYKARWYLLSALGGAWMLLGIALLILMIIAL